ncbi:unnamed protein product [Symbiodinium sp. CCMP2456]|nr:unnamed protein product [Symbiodinium sp. CCMP2456]
MVLQVLPQLESAEHEVVLKATVVLFQRFCGTAAASPDLDKLVPAVKELALPTLLKFGQQMTARRAFQAACALTPLLNRAAVLAAQCCALAIKGPWKADVVLPFYEAVADLEEVFSRAIIARAEMLRPFDASRIFASHKHFEECQAVAAKAVAASGIPLDVSTSDLARLAPLPAKPVHCWRYEQLRQFWETSCSQYSGKVPVDVLAILLLQAAGAELSLVNREALMRRLHACAHRSQGEVLAAQWSRCWIKRTASGSSYGWVETADRKLACDRAPGPNRKVADPGLSSQSMLSYWEGRQQAYIFPASKRLCPLLSRGV